MILAATLALGGMAIASMGMLARALPQPEGFWPLTVSGWLSLVGTAAFACGAALILFGPFLKERLRRFLADAETLRLLHEQVSAILETPDGARVIKEVVTQQFAERIRLTAEMREDLNDAMVNIEFNTRMIAQQGEVMRAIAVALTALPRIEEQGRNVRKEVTRLGRLMEQRGTQIDSLMGEMRLAALGRRAHPRTALQGHTHARAEDAIDAEGFAALAELDDLEAAIDAETDPDLDADDGPGIPE